MLGSTAGRAPAPRPQAPGLRARRPGRAPPPPGRSPSRLRLCPRIVPPPHRPAPGGRRRHDPLDRRGRCDPSGDAGAAAARALPVPSTRMPVAPADGPDRSARGIFRPGERRQGPKRAAAAHYLQGRKPGNTRCEGLPRGTFPEPRIFRRNPVARPARLRYIPPTQTAERCRSGRTGRSRKPLTLHGVPGFESLSLRQNLLRSC